MLLRPTPPSLKTAETTLTSSTSHSTSTTSIPPPPLPFLFSARYSSFSLPRRRPSSSRPTSVSPCSAVFDNLYQHQPSSRSHFHTLSETAHYLFNVPDFNLRRGYFFSYLRYLIYLYLRRFLSTARSSRLIMSANVAHSRLSEIFNEEAAAAVAAAQATAAAAENILPAQLRAPSIAPSLTYSESGDDRDEYDVDEAHLSSDDEVASIATPRRRRASTRLIAQNAADIQRITGESSTQLINRCCGGGCCLSLDSKADGVQFEAVPLPDNEAFRSLNLKIGNIPTTLTNVADIPEQIAYLLPVSAKTTDRKSVV